MVQHRSQSGIAPSQGHTSHEPLARPAECLADTPARLRASSVPSTTSNTRLDRIKRLLRELRELDSQPLAMPELYEFLPAEYAVEDVTGVPTEEMDSRDDGAGSASLHVLAQRSIQS